MQRCLLSPTLTLSNNTCDWFISNGVNLDSSTLHGQFPLNTPLVASRCFHGD